MRANGRGVRYGVRYGSKPCVARPRHSSSTFLAVTSSAPQSGQGRSRLFRIKSDRSILLLRSRPSRRPFRRGCQFRFSPPVSGAPFDAIHSPCMTSHFFSVIFRYFSLPTRFLPSSSLSSRASRIPPRFASVPVAGCQGRSRPQLRPRPLFCSFRRSRTCPWTFIPCAPSLSQAGGRRVRVVRQRFGRRGAQKCPSRPVISHRNLERATAHPARFPATPRIKTKFPSMCRGR